ncbi:hypothetical protein PAEPH01_0446 [Pancytospora epiphaga]|nr:hypothetical protein PAEPH01_0446 [Pancytospora epiphaga]
MAVFIITFTVVQLILLSLSFLVKWMCFEDPMDVNLADFPVEKAIIYVSEDQCIYDMPVTNLEAAWNSLARYYSDKVHSANTEVVKTNNFYREIAHCNIENETALTVFWLIKQDVTRKYPCLATHERPASLAKYILSSVREILVKRLLELKKNIDNERAVFRRIKGISHEVEINGGRICVYFTQTCILSFKSFDELFTRQLYGLSCVISFGEIRLSYYEDNTNPEYSELVDSHYYEEMLPQTYEKEGLCVKISKEKIRGDDDGLCKTVLAELKRGHSLEQIHDLIVIGLSRVAIGRLVRGYRSVRFVDTDGSKLADGYSYVFFVLADEHVFKVCRKENTFDIYLNGSLLEICF